jgi:hypothetical protein
MRPIGFSTGAVAPGNIRQAMAILAPYPVTAVELSALRLEELPDVLVSLNEPWLQKMQYVSFHAPSRWKPLTDRELIAQLQPMIDKGWPIIIHPDAINDWDAWARLGKQLVVENMDGRKPMGRTVEELETVYARLPEARFCFDIGHAHQLDSTQQLGRKLLTSFGDRLTEVHWSMVSDSYAHQPVTMAMGKEFGVLLKSCPTTPIILETPVVAATLAEQWQLAQV